uniref:PIPK domain-containing protein n=1 Tax=Globodera pallida TaxID=36090 RepID=A0A183BL00_GLOPA
MFEKSNLGIQIALNDELNGLDSVPILQKLLNETSEQANSDQNESASGSDQTKVGEKPNSDLKAHHPYSESNLGIINALNDGLSALGEKKPNSDQNDHHYQPSASGSSHEAKAGKKMKQKKKHKSVKCQKKLDERMKKWMRMRPAAKKQSSSEEMAVIPTNLPFGEAEEEEESVLYEQTPFISASLGTENLMRLFQIQFCDEAISIQLKEEKGENDDQFLAGAIRLGLRNAFCFSFFNSLNLPLAFKLKIGTEEEEFNNKYNHRAFYFHHMLLYDAKVEPISKSVNNGTFDLVFRAPYVFKALRAVFDYRSATVTGEELIQSIAQKPLKMFPNPAQSGAKFLQTNDGQFFIKSTDSVDLQFFDTFLFERTRSYDDGPIDFFVGGIWYYYEYLRAQILEKKQSLLPKFYALFDLENIQSSEKQSFIMINNIFPSNFPKIHYKFDLKGASMNRKVLKSKDDNPAHKTCRDLDFFRYNSEDRNGTMLEGLFRHGICIEPKQHEQLTKTLENDTLFLKSHNITDYSLLLGVHFIDNEKLPAEWLGELPFGVLRGTCNNCKNPFRNAYENDQKLLLSIGIIDTLQTYDFFRQCENAYKSSKSLFIQSEGYLFPPSSRRKYRPNSVKKPNVYQRKQGIDPGAGHSVLTMPKRVDVGVQVEPQRVDAGVQKEPQRVDVRTQTSAEGLNALISAKNEIAMLRQCLRELSTRNEELEKKLTTKTTNFLQKNARKPRKVLEDVTPRQLQNRAKKIAQVFRSCSPGSPGSPASRSLFRQARRALGVSSPTKNVPNLSVEQDVNLTIRSGISFSARRMIKQHMLTLGIDCWAATSAVDQLKAAFGTAQTFEWQGTAADGALFCTNISETVRRRVDMLAKNGLISRPPRDEKMPLVLTGDKGGTKGSTKFGFIVPLKDQERSNAPANFTLLCIYKGDDNRRNIESRMAPVLQQLRQLDDFEFLLSGDMKFIAAFMGHQGSAANFPCVLCHAKNGELGSSPVDARTLEGMRADAQVGRHSIASQPFLDIASTNIVPPTLHILMGIGQRLLDYVERVAGEDGRASELEQWLKTKHCRRDPRSRNYTGNGIKGLLSDPSPEELACFLPAGELRDVLLQLMWGLRIVYSLSKARVLDEEELNKLEEWTKKFFDRWQWLKRFEPRVASNTPKLHWLCCHLTEFARRRRWFALVSEQCIEHIHSHFDRLAPRYKNTGSEEKTMMKLARHQAILNSLHALGHVDEGRNSDENESPTPIADENDPPSGRRMTQ